MYSDFTKRRIGDQALGLKSEDMIMFCLVRAVAHPKVQ
jgi:hypothetical protein